jgi:indolepyruvate ferredoxin oxidoreductase beta subunit
MTKSILLVGVGGQGTILAAKLLTIGLMQAGHDVKMSEIHGMSQRGGSVSSHVRYGEKVESPVIELGGADIIVAFEKMEALRWLEYLKPGGEVIVNDYQINPMPFISGAAVYSNDIMDELRKNTQTTAINASDEAKALGNSRMTNTILLGAAIEKMGLGNIDWDKIIKEQVKATLVDANIAAINRGKELTAK